MKYIIIFCLCILTCERIACQDIITKTTSLSQEMIPNDLHFKGALLEAQKWTDKNGENILILSKEGPINGKKMGPDFYTKTFRLFASQYLKTNNFYSLLWTTKDSVIDCDTDMLLDFLPNSTTITDLDNDGITETTLVYRKACRGDVSPSKMTVLIHKGSIVYRLQGRMYSSYILGKLDKNDFDYNLDTAYPRNKVDRSNAWAGIFIGRYLTEDDFKDAPAVLLKYAKTKWVDYVDKDEFK
jgi:hypothetical protein